jgi:hypothetical protein
MANKLKLITFLVVAFAVVFAGSAQADLQVDSCQTLYAGQSIDAGTVCVEVSGDNLLVRYETKDGWELTEAHLWVGDDLADMPQTKKGNPKVGNFPYHAGSITESNLYEFTIPLLDLGGDDFATSLCDQTFLVAAHASLRKDNGSGGSQTETGWAYGTRMVPRGNWATYFNFVFSCDDTGVECETAFAFGDKELWDITDTNRWGWQITVNLEDDITTEIYAGAGQNDTTKGTHVGNLHISYVSGSLTVEYEMFEDFTMTEYHLYVGSKDTTTASPGEFPYTNDNLGGITSESFDILISGQKIYIVAHAVVCGQFE